MKEKLTRALNERRACCPFVATILMATAITFAQNTPGHSIPAEKGLSADWIKGLYEGREPLSWSGKDLTTIGMPVGGLCAGQLYLRGDGTLASWEIFNKYVFTGWGESSYKTYTPESPVDSGFAVAVTIGGRTSVKPLNKTGFPACEFAGEYPVGLVRYADKGFPVKVTMEAFSPFIPLNAQDSALPATLFHITVANTTDKPLETAVLGYLENAVCRDEEANIGAVATREITTCRDTNSVFKAMRRSRVTTTEKRGILVHSIEPVTPHAERPPIVFEDFEGKDFGKWQVEGLAFSQGPTRGRVTWQRKLNGWCGQQLANSFLVVRDANGNADRKRSIKGEATGSLTSPEFKIERDYITFYIGKGDQVGKTCINLLIDGKVVRSTTGSSNGKFDLLQNSLLWNFWDVSEFAGRTARIQILDAAKDGDNRHASAEVVVDQIVFCDIGGLRGAGTLALTLDGPAGDAAAILKAGSFPATISAEVESTSPTGQRRSGAVATPRVTLAPGQEHTFTFVLSWFLPNHKDGREYARRFNSAQAVADYVLDNHERLSGDTRLWHKTFYEDSTLPRWLLFRLHSTVANMATGTLLWWGNGRVWGWEGVGSCEGTCTHVYNYAQAHAYLFPEMARIIREMQDFGEGFDPGTGLVGFRSNRDYAADGQCGTVLKAYREHRMSADDAFLTRNWPTIKKILEYAIGQDGNDDGLIEGSQHNTYDIDFVGPNTFVGALYLAALRAGEEMAGEVGDPEFASRCRKIFESGSKLTMARLWNGEYFIQRLEPNTNPKSQYGDGCLSDQLFGQSWARSLNLGLLYPEDAVKQAYQSVWRYNWTMDVGAYNKVHKPERVFAGAKEPGLLICTWPKSAYPVHGVRYSEEVWTGIEYEVADGMLREGLTDEALSICRGIQDRYHPARHNPFDEVECGDHYARSLASWGVYNALLGFEYHGPRGIIGFSPRLSPENFRAAFTTAEGWGLYEQTRRAGEQTAHLEVRRGKLRLQTVVLNLADGVKASTAEAFAANRPVSTTMKREGNRLEVSFPRITLSAGESLDIVFQ